MELQTVPALGTTKWYSRGLLVFSLLITPLLGCAANGNVLSAGLDEFGRTIERVVADIVVSEVQTGWSRLVEADTPVFARATQRVGDDGFVVIGMSQNHLHLIRTDARGRYVSTETLPATGRGNVVRRTTDGGFIFVGEERIAKTDASGRELWGRPFSDSPRAVRETVDGGFVVTGTRDIIVAGKMGLWRYDANGNLMWDRTLEMVDDEEQFSSGSSVEQTADGGFIVAGSTGFAESYGSHEFYIVKTNAEGSREWERSFRMDVEDHEFHIAQWASVVTPTRDGGYIVGGGVYIPETRYTALPPRDDAYLLKLDNRGRIQWKQEFIRPSMDSIHSIQETSDGGYIVAGSTAPPGEHAPTHMLLLKTNALGTPEWQRNITGGPPWDRYADGGILSEVQQTADGGYLLAGGYSAMRVVKTDEQGQTVGSPN